MIEKVHAMSKFLRIVLAIVVVVVTWVAVAWVKRGYMCDEIEPLKRDLAELPVQIGEWKGSPYETSEELVGRLHALALVDREYKKANAEPVMLHAVWTDDYMVMHLPEQCYTLNGWRIDRSEDLKIPVAEGVEFNARLFTFERQGHVIKVLHWYQLGERTFFSNVAFRLARQQLCWGEKKWPALTKVMLQTTAESMQAEVRIKQFAAYLYCYINGLETPSM